MTRARIKPNWAQSQYGSRYVDGYILHVEGGETRHFRTREQAAEYARSKGFCLYGQ